MRLRAAEASDRAQIVALEQASQLYPWTSADLSQFPSSIDRGWVMEDQGQIVAWLGARLLAQEAEVLNMAVRPAWRQRGLGRELLAALLTQVDRLGIERVLLEVRQSNLRAQALYRRCGFVVCGQRKGYYRSAGNQREDALVMQRLSAAPAAE